MKKEQLEVVERLGLTGALILIALGLFAVAFAIHAHSHYLPMHNLSVINTHTGECFDTDGEKL